MVQVGPGLQIHGACLGIFLAMPIAKFPPHTGISSSFRASPPNPGAERKRGQYRPFQGEGGAVLVTLRKKLTQSKTVNPNLKWIFSQYKKDGDEVFRFFLARVDWDVKAMSRK